MAETLLLAPFWPLVVGSLAVAFTRGALQNLVSVAAPLLALVLVWTVPEGSATVSWLGMTLTPVAPDATARVFGTAFAFAAIAGAIFALDQKSTAERAAVLLYAAAARGVVFAGDLLTLFVFWERHRERVQRDALLDLHLFSLRIFSWGNVTAAMVAVGEFAIIFVLPLYLTAALGLSIMQTGLVLAAMAFGAFASGAAARHLAARFGSPGTVLIGLGLEVVGVLVLAALASATTPGWLIALPLVVYGLGLGLASAQLTGTVLRDVPVEISGQGSATQSTVRQIGTALGTAFAGAALSISLAVTLPGALSDAGITGTAATELADATRTSAGTLISQLRAQGASSMLGAQTDAAVQALSAGFADATRWSLLVASAFLLLGLVGAARLHTFARR